MIKLSYRNFNITITPDPDPMNPREDDNLGIMYCFHRRYSLGDKHDNKTPFSPTQVKELHDEKAIILPLYLLDHSGLSISLTPFNDRFDSGQIGFYVCPTSRIIETYSEDTPENRITALSVLKAEVSDYNSYLQGDSFFLVVSDSNDKEIFSAGSLLAYSESELITLARSQIDAEISHRFSKRLSSLKKYIKNNVPLHIRQKLLAKES